MHHLVELRGQLGVNRRNCAIDRARKVAVKSDRASERLLDQRFDEFLRTVRFGLSGRGNNLVEEAGGFGSFGNRSAGFGS